MYLNWFQITGSGDLEVNVKSLTGHLVAQTAWAPPSAEALPGTYGPMCLEGLPALLVTHVGQLNMQANLHFFVGIFHSERKRRETHVCFSGKTIFEVEFPEG